MHDTTDSPKSHQTRQGDDTVDNEAPCSSPLEDPFIYTPSPHNEEEEVISSQVVIPDRDFRQPRSSGGKLAYVIFGDLTTGVYYNWNSCEYKLNSYSHGGNRKPRFYGYATYDEAAVAWEFFLDNHVVPFSPLDGGVSATPVPSAQPMTPQHNRPLSLASRSLPTPQFGSPSRASLGSPSGRPPLYSQLPPSSQPRSILRQQTTETMFFVVLVGYNPGVFVTHRLAAINSRGDGPILEARSRHEANQMFVDAFMSDRVQRLY